jgi:mannose-6-phosphate isomerase-like protein (cupin superfamily)
MAHEILTPAYEREDDRGIFREIFNGFEGRTLAWGRMRSGAVMGNHFHRRTRVFFCILSGSAEIETVAVETGERDAFPLAAGQAVILEPGESHAIRYREESEFLMAKSQPYDPKDPDTFPHPVRP